MTAKEYLKGIRYYRNQIRQARRQKEEIGLSLSAIKGIDYTRDKIQTSPRNATEAAGWKLAGRIADLNREIEFLTMAVHERLEAIRELEPPYSDVLYKRYAEYKQWEQIADELNYAVNYVMGELHGRALEMIRIKKEPVE